jgi:hypothetical protein
MQALIDQPVLSLEEELVEYQGLSEVRIPAAHGALCLGLGLGGLPALSLVGVAFRHTAAACDAVGHDVAGGPGRG